MKPYMRPSKNRDWIHGTENVNIVIELMLATVRHQTKGTEYMEQLKRREPSTLNIEFLVGC